MQLSREDILKVAVLAKLELSEAQVGQFTDKMLRVLDMVRQLGQVDTQGIDEMAHPGDVHSVVRDDVLVPSLDRSAALQNAPSTDGEYFLVPPVLG